MTSWRGAVLLGAGLLFAAGLLDAEPLYVPGVALLALGVGVRAWIALAGRGAKVDRIVSGRTIVEDEPLPVHFIAVAGRLPFPAGEVADPLLDRPVPLPSGRRELVFTVGVRFARRGPRTIEPTTLTVRDPLGLAREELTGSDEARVLVLPGIFPVLGADGGGAVSGSGARLALTGAAETEVDGVREYRDGTPASRIHWAALARHDRLMERHVRPEVDARPLVVLDARAPVSPEALDAAVRAAASLCHELAGRGGCCALLPGDRRVTEIDDNLAAWPALHARFALVVAGPAPALGASGVRAGPILYVAAHIPRGGRPRGLERVPPGSHLVVPAGSLGGRAAFSVAGCEGHSLTADRRAIA